jgi:hypothetical protein
MGYRFQIYRKTMLFTFAWIVNGGLPEGAVIA